jgi:5-methylcytosine-specific restriction endonuclease McrA
MKPPVFRPAYVPSPEQARREYEHSRYRRDPWRKWFGTKAWAIKRRAQLDLQPLCQRCLKAGVVTPATVANHIIAHRGDPVLFWQGELESVCASCHSSIIQSEESQ